MVLDDTSFDIGDYYKPKSLTWWTGVLALSIGLAKGFGLEHAGIILVSSVISQVAGGGTSAAQLIITGLGLIGIRAKLGRVPGSGQ